MTKKNARAAGNMVKGHIARNPPAKYNIGEEVFVRVLPPDANLRRGGRSLKSIISVRARVIDVDQDKYKYQVSFDDKECWVSVADVTALTRDDQNRKQREAQSSKYIENNIVNMISKHKCLTRHLQSSMFVSKITFSRAELYSYTLLFPKVTLLKYTMIVDSGFVP